MKFYRVLDKSLVEPVEPVESVESMSIIEVSAPVRRPLSLALTLRRQVVS